MLTSVNRRTNSGDRDKKRAGGIIQQKPSSTGLNTAPPPPLTPEQKARLEAERNKPLGSSIDMSKAGEEFHSYDGDNHK